jgi:Zn finger protein HypA/HybF involved in hydrogenase expression
MGMMKLSNGLIIRISVVKCLKCDKEFESLNKRTHRLCSHCAHENIGIREGYRVRLGARVYASLSD